MDMENSASDDGEEEEEEEDVVDDAAGDTKDWRSRAAEADGGWTRSDSDSDSSRR
jgi:hypothetical protein